ncbi:unnamed protein product [Calypogeia fissa]
MKMLMILREAPASSLVCCIRQGRRYHRLPSCRVHSSGTSSSSETMRTNFSAYGLERTPFLGKSVQNLGLGFRIPNSEKAMSLQGRILHSMILFSGVGEEPDKSRGGLPRFHVDSLPTLEGMVAKVEGDEFSHMTRVLRLKVDDRIELFDGRGGIVNGQLMSISRTAAEVVTLENLHQLSPVAPHWHVAAAFCTLKGGRGEWLVEKCTELGARRLTPLLTQRSSSVSGGRTDRWQRIALAATKQCQRLHSLDIEEPTSLQAFLPQVSRAEVAFVATAGAPPLYEMMSRVPNPLQSGILLIGPEGDFTPDELNSLVSIGVTPVGLGPRRLRVETATVAMLAAVMLLVDTKARTCQTEIEIP